MRPLFVLVFGIVIAAISACTLQHFHKRAAQHAKSHVVHRQPLTKASSPPPTLGAPQLEPQQAEGATPVVTLGDEQDARANAQRIVEQATLKLAQIDRARLTKNDEPAYQQAGQLVGAAQTEMRAHDYLAASNLARKASALMSQFLVATPRAFP